MRSRDYLFAQDLKCMLREKTNILPCNVVTFPHLFRNKFLLTSWKPFLKRHYPIFVFINQKLLWERGGGM